LRAKARRPLAIGLVVVAAALASEVRASDVVERARAERLAAAGRCDEALPILTGLTASEPNDARLALLRGDCELRLDRFEDALVSLRRARALDPKLPDVDVSIAAASFHAGDFEGALNAVADARRAGSTRPELNLYEGLALFGLERDADAARSLEMAGQGGARSLDPVASYYAGMAWKRAGDQDRAREALRRVIIDYPGSEWAVAAQRALDGATTTAMPVPRMWARVRAGMEWNSNAVFIGNGVALPEDISNESDFLGVVTAEFGSEFYRSGPWSLGARADYVGTAHTEVGDFDLQYPGFGLWVDHRLSDVSLLRLDYSLHYGWLGYDAYVTSNLLTPQWMRDFGSRGLLRVYGEFAYNDFHSNAGGVADGPGAVGDPCVGVAVCGPPGLDESAERNRDGIGGRFGFDHTLPVASMRGSVWGGLFYEFYDSRGTEYQFDGYGVRAGFRSELPAQLTLFGWAGYTYRPFRHASTYPDPDDPNIANRQEYGLSAADRTDNVVEVEVELARPITDSLSASIRYAYLWNSSNVAVYDYDQNVVGAYLTWVWSR
jgi:tetratricopeptide (TPR) repeat protein